MAGKGPPRTPTAILRLTGSRLAAARSDEPQPTTGEPQRPVWLTPEAVGEWEAVVPELSRIGVLTVVDGTALAVYCQAVADYRSHRAAIEEEGWTTTTSQGRGKNPRAVLLKEAQDAILKFACQYGLTPSARAHLKAPEGPTVDPLGEFAAGKDAGAASG